MLIKVFGIWLMASNISYMLPDNESCEVYFIAMGKPYYSERYREFPASCDEVAVIINKQIKGQADD